MRWTTYGGLLFLFALPLWALLFRLLVRVGGVRCQVLLKVVEIAGSVVLVDAGDRISFTLPGKIVLVKLFAHDRNQSIREPRDIDVLSESIRQIKSQKPAPWIYFTVCDEGEGLQPTDGIHL